MRVKVDKILVRDEPQLQNSPLSPNFSKAQEHLGLELLFSLLEAEARTKTLWDVCCFGS